MLKIFFFLNKFYFVFKYLHFKKLYEFCFLFEYYIFQMFQVSEKKIFTYFNKIIINFWIIFDITVRYTLKQ